MEMLLVLQVFVGEHMNTFVKMIGQIDILTWLWRYMKGWWIAKVIKIRPEGNMNVWAKLQGNLPNSCQDILLKNTNVNLMVVLKEA